MSNIPPSKSAPEAESEKITSIAPEAALPSQDEAQKANTLSKEEQMAAFEEDLKFNDWGHQPC